jgi:hypothetical protein
MSPTRGWIQKPSSPWFGTTKAIVLPFADVHVINFEGQDWAHYGRSAVPDRPRIIEHTWSRRATRGRELMLWLTFVGHYGEPFWIPYRHNATIR